MDLQENILCLEKIINYSFNNKQIIQQALTHSSYANEHKMKKFTNNERIEFLGDAVLEIVVSDYLFRQDMEMLEGELTKKRASIVCEPTLAYFAKKIELGKYILLGKGEELSGGRNRASVLSDAVEALIGGIYLDGGIDEATDFIHNQFLSNLDQTKLFVDSKTHLQEMIQRESDEPLVYKIVGEKGPDHNKVFEVSVFHNEKELGQGVGRSKKAAEQEAAFDAIHNL